MKKLFDTTVDMQIRLFYVLAWTACIANTLGFVSNLIFFGPTGETWFCGACAVVMCFAAFWGIWQGSIEPAKKLILFVVNVLEFPFLYYVYGPGRIIYMALGIVGILMFQKKSCRHRLAFAVMVYDAAVMVVSVLYPCQIMTYSQKDDMGAAVASFVIVIVSIILILLILLRQYEDQNREAVELARELAQMANLDPLTQLYNRRYLTEYLDRRMADPEAELAVALLDLDDFKSVNDRYGHLYGDDVLKAFASSMKNHIEGMGIAARYGGEEFMLVFDHSDKERIIRVLDEIQREIGAFSKETGDFVLTYSGGVEIFQKEDRVIQLFNAADENLYAAKQAGKHRYFFGNHKT